MSVSLYVNKEYMLFSFRKNWEKTPVHIKRNFPKYYKLLMSTPMLDKILRESYILFTKNIDITSYENGIRETHNPVGRAVPTVVWDYYMNGCSVRMLNPQTYIPKLHSLNGIYFSEINNYKTKIFSNKNIKMILAIFLNIFFI